MTAAIVAAAVTGLAVTPVLVTLSLTYGVDAINRRDAGATVLNAALAIVSTMGLMASLRVLTLTIGGSAL